ncbi:Peroxisomal biogenesis factor 6 [Durusdinium trenchii]|uniref:Peroxisomal biogenesis factor 6 n=1 Tax=Durusdinium trenchii TaxID=1381693 RepID=A0ABP0LXW8_9DINO
MLNFITDQVTGNHESDHEGGGHCNPCCSICMGILLIIIAPYVIWNTEGDYVKTMRALDAAGKTAVEPCPYNDAGSCANCKLDTLKEQQLVFLACDFENMKTLSNLQKDGFGLSALAPMVNGVEKAVKFSWSAEMYQWKQTSKDPIKLQMDVMDCTAAGTLDDDSDPDQTKRRQLCCAGPSTPGRKKFKAEYYGATKTCQPYKGATGNQETASSFAISAEDDLEDDLEKGVEEFEEISAEESPGEVTKDMLNTSSSRVESISVRRASDVGRVGLLRKGGSSDSRRRRTSFTCEFPCYHWDQDWFSEAATDPKTWSPTPTFISQVGWLKGAPAKNLNLPYNDATSFISDVTIGGIEIGTFDPISGALGSTTARLSQTGASQGEDLSTAVAQKETWDGVNVTTYTRDVEWTAKEAFIGAKTNCLVSRRAATYQPGDLRMCFQRSTLSKVSVIAAVTKTAAGGYSLVVSKDHLRAKTKLRSSAEGYRMRADRIMSLEELLAEENSTNEGFLWAGRIVGPIILWLAFYCFLQPILWFMDKFGDCLDQVPCVGGCLGLIADFIETLVGILICIVSCCLGLGCGLFAMAIAWIYYRPIVGVPLLLLSVAMFGGVVYFAYTRKGAQKVRRRSSARQQPVGEATELLGATAQPAAAQAAPAVAQAVVMPQPTLMQVQCPANASEGSQIVISTPDGRQVQVQVPAGVQPGQVFQVQA